MNATQDWEREAAVVIAVLHKSSLRNYAMIPSALFASELER